MGFKCPFVTRSYESGSNGLLLAPGQRGPVRYDLQCGRSMHEVRFNNNGLCERDLDPSSKQFFHLMMNSRAGPGAEERHVAFTISPCFSFRTPTSLTFVLTDKARNTLFFP